MTRVLIVGGTGFIGRHLAGALAIAGHAVTAVGRGDLDLVRDSDAALVARLTNHDVVINCAGLIRSRGTNTMMAVHAGGIGRLAYACRAAGVRRLIHLSALGAAADGDTDYQRSKGQGEHVLGDAGRHADGPACCILRPSVVVGQGGASTRLLCALAALPLTPRLGPGTWFVQPVHVDDLAALVVRLVEREGMLPASLDVVGPEAMTIDQAVATLCAWLGLPRRRGLGIPEGLLGVVARIGDRFIDSPINRELLVMLKAGNTADPAPFAAVLGRMPHRLALALAARPATRADRQAAGLFFVRPLLRWSLAVLWLATAALSFGLYPVADSIHMLATIGLEGRWADVALYGAAGLDLGLGSLLLLGKRPVAVGYAMLATMAAFTALATGLPAEYWLHPFAPLLKNLPLAAATLAMMTLEA